MTTGSKVATAGAIICGALMVWAGLHYLDKKPRDKTRVIYEGPGEIHAETPTPLPTTADGPQAAALAITTPTPPQISMTQEVLDKMIAEAIAKAQPRPTPQPAFTPDPTIMANISEESRLREGFVLTDLDGKKFLRIYRKDGHPVTEGLTSDTVAIEAWKQPIYTNMGDGTWDIVLKERTIEEIKPQATPSPSAASNHP